MKGIKDFLSMLGYLMLTSRIWLLRLILCICWWSLFRTKLDATAFLLQDLSSNFKIHILRRIYYFVCLFAIGPGSNCEDSVDIDFILTSDWLLADTLWWDIRDADRSKFSIVLKNFDVKAFLLVLGCFANDRFFARDLSVFSDHNSFASAYLNTVFEHTNVLHYLVATFPSW